MVRWAGLPFDDHGPALAVRALRRLAGLPQATMFLLLGRMVTPHEVWRERTPALWMAAARCCWPVRWRWPSACGRWHTGRNWSVRHEDR